MRRIFALLTMLLCAACGNNDVQPDITTQKTNLVEIYNVAGTGAVYQIIDRQYGNICYVYRGAGISCLSMRDQE